MEYVAEVYRCWGHKLAGGPSRDAIHAFVTRYFGTAWYSNGWKIKQGVIHHDICCLSPVL